MGKNSKHKEKLVGVKSAHKIIRGNMAKLMGLDFDNYKEQKEDSLKRLKSLCNKRSDKQKIEYVTFLDDAIHHCLTEQTQACFPQNTNSIISPDSDPYELLDNQKAMELLIKAGEKTFIEITDLLLTTDSKGTLYKNAPEIGKYE